jgi:glutathione S-transferase
MIFVLAHNVGVHRIQQTVSPPQTKASSIFRWRRLQEKRLPVWWLLAVLVAACSRRLANRPVIAYSSYSPSHYSRHEKRQAGLLARASGSSNDNKGWFAPLQTLLSSSGNRGGVAAAMIPEPVQKVLEDLNSSNELPSWKSLRQRLVEQQEQAPNRSQEEIDFRTYVVQNGYGSVANPLQLVRWYSPEIQQQYEASEPPVTFYRDSASWCPYCQKVWMFLEEKQIPYRVEKINMRCYGDKPLSFQMLQPSGQIPVATIKTRGESITLRQSNDIMAALEEHFPQRSLRPPAALETQAKFLLKLERTLFSAWMYWLTAGRSGNEDTAAKSQFESVLLQVETALRESEGPYFCGKSISLVDIQFTPFLERMVASLLYYKGYEIRGSTKFPHLNIWFTTLAKNHPSYQVTMSDYYTHNWDLPPQLGGCTSEHAGESARQVINGEKLDGNRGWDLSTLKSTASPSSTSSNFLEPDDDWDWAVRGDRSGDTARREVIERFTFNHENIVKFACRGGVARDQRGRRYGAPLADPDSPSNTSLHSTVDVCLRTIVYAMLETNTVSENSAMRTPLKDDVVSSVLSKIRNSLDDSFGSDSEFRNGVMASLEYMRDRIGVPRDMRLPAARQLRAYSNWVIQELT